MNHNSLCRTFVLLLVCLLCCSPAMASYPADSITVQHDSVCSDYSFSPVKLAVPLAVTAVGTVGAFTFKGFRQSVDKQFSKWRGDRYWHGDDYIQYVPAAAYLGLGLCGVKSRNNFRDRLLAGATAYICMAAVVNVVKVGIHEERPDGSAHNSFPSGHTATAFTGAELMRIEYGNYIGAAGYAAAVAVGFLRMYNSRHWYNDIIAGAGIGVLSARVGYWLLPLERRLFGFDKSDKTSIAVVPTYSPYDRSIGFSCTAFF